LFGLAPDVRHHDDSDYPDSAKVRAKEPDIDALPRFIKI
jgi:hypothetical protein